MKKIVVLEVIAELGDGGVETMLMDIYKNMDRNKFKFIFVVQNDKRRYCDEIVKMGGEVVQITSLKKAGIIGYISQIKNLCIKKHADVVHCHNLTQNPFILFAAKRAGIKIRISHSHLTTCFTKKAKIFMPLIRLLINIYSTDKLACGLDAGLFLYGKSKFKIINNAIDIDKFNKKGNISQISDLPQNLDNKYIILHVGRLSEQKNHKFIIELANNIKNKNIVFLCCGTGPLEKDISSMIKNNGLQNMIYLLGSRSDVPALMSASNLLILPSLYEGLPVTLIESQASGLKAIISNKIDRNCDLGLDLIDFLPIDNVDKWCDLIDYYIQNGYSCDKNIKNILIAKGYDSKNNCTLLSNIYSRFCDKE